MKRSPAKLIAKLNAKINRFDRAPSGSNGINSIDVAHAMGYLDLPAQSLLLRVKWGGDITALPDLVEILKAMVNIRAKRRQWDVRKPDIIERMVHLALRECEVIRKRRVLTSTDCPYECGAEKCRGCRGVGRRYSTRQAKIITCERCNGSGDRCWTSAERASQCGLHHSTFEEKWESRCLDTVEMIRSLERAAMGKIRACTAEPVEEEVR